MHVAVAPSHAAPSGLDLTLCVPVAPIFRFHGNGKGVSGASAAVQQIINTVDVPVYLSRACLTNVPWTCPCNASWTCPLRAADVAAYCALCVSLSRNGYGEHAMA